MPSDDLLSTPADVSALTRSLASWPTIHTTRRPAMASDRDTLAEATRLLRDPEIRAAMETLVAHGIRTAADFDAVQQRLTEY